MSFGARVFGGAVFGDDLRTFDDDPGTVTPLPAPPAWLDFLQARRAERRVAKRGGLMGYIAPSADTSAVQVVAYVKAEDDPDDIRQGRRTYRVGTIHIAAREWRTKGFVTPPLRGGRLTDEDTIWEVVAVRARMHRGFPMRWILEATGAPLIRDLRE